MDPLKFTLLELQKRAQFIYHGVVFVFVFHLLYRMDIFDAPLAPPPSLHSRHRSWASDSTTLDPVVAQAIAQGVRRERAKKQERNLRAVWDHELHRGSLVQQATVANEWHRHLLERANTKCFQDAIDREEHRKRISVWGDHGKNRYLKLVQKEVSQIASEGSLNRLQSVKDRSPTPYPFFKAASTNTSAEPSLSASRATSSRSNSKEDSIYESFKDSSSASNKTHVLPLADLTIKADIDPEDHHVALAAIVRKAHIRRRKNRTSSKLPSNVSVV